MCKTCRMDNLEVREVPHPSPCHWDKATPWGHIWVTSVTFTSVLYSLWFSYFCNKSDSCLTKSELGWTPGVHFLVIFLKLKPKEAFEMCSFPNFPVKVYLIPLFSPALSSTQVQGHWVADENMLANVEVAAGGWGEEAEMEQVSSWLNLCVSSPRRCFLIPPGWVMDLSGWHLQLLEIVILMSLGPLGAVSPVPRTEPNISLILNEWIANSGH